MNLKLDMIGLTAKDMNETMAFYRLLGWNFEAPEDRGPYTEISLPCGMRVSINAESMVKETHPNWQEPRGQRIGLAFLCESPAEVDAAYAKITAAGYRGAAAPWDAFWGQRYAQVEDPDGNLVDLFAPLG